MAKPLTFARQTQAGRQRRSKTMLLPMPCACANDLALQVHLALAALRRGGARHDAQALLHVQVLTTTMADAGYGTLTQAQVNDADAALLACFERGQSGRGWHLDKAGFDAIAPIVTVYDEQLQCAPLWVLTEATERLARMGAGQPVMRKQA